VVGLFVKVLTGPSKDVVLEKVYIHEILLLSRRWKWRGSRKGLLLLKSSIKTVCIVKGIQLLRPG